MLFKFSLALYIIISKLYYQLIKITIDIPTLFIKLLSQQIYIPFIVRPLHNCLTSILIIFPEKVIDMLLCRDDKTGQPASHWPAPRLARKNAGRVGPPCKVIAG